MNKKYFIVGLFTSLLLLFNFNSNLIFSAPKIQKKVNTQHLRRINTPSLVNELRKEKALSDARKRANPALEKILIEPKLLPNPIISGNHITNESIMRRALLIPETPYIIKKDDIQKKIDFISQNAQAKSIALIINELFEKQKINSEYENYGDPNWEYFYDFNDSRYDWFRDIFEPPIYPPRPPLKRPDYRKKFYMNDSLHNRFNNLFVIKSRNNLTNYSYLQTQGIRLPHFFYSNNDWRINHLRLLSIILGYNTLPGIVNSNNEIELLPSELQLILKRIQNKRDSINKSELMKIQLLNK